MKQAPHPHPEQVYDERVERAKTFALSSGWPQMTGKFVNADGSIRITFGSKHAVTLPSTPPREKPKKHGGHFPPY